MASNPQEFRAKTRKLVTLPSGLTVEIRKVRAANFIGLREIPLPSAAAAAATDGEQAISAVDREQIAAFARILITKGATAPRFSDRDEDLTNSEVVHISDLEDADFKTLVEEISLFSGYTKEAAADAESFRKVEEPQADRRAGDALRQAAE